jgi:transcriptional regulator with XRE-family HTH domain
VEFDYSELRNRIKAVFGTEQEFAKALGIGRVALSQKLNNTSDFTCKQMLKAAELLGFGVEEIPFYFFTEKFRNMNLIPHLSPDKMITN